MPPGSGSHAIARAPGALDALCLMYTMTKYTKEAMFPHTGTWTLNEFILAAGDATADNLAPKFSQIQYAWRAPDLKIAEQIGRVLEQQRAPRRRDDRLHRLDPVGDQDARRPAEPGAGRPHLSQPGGARCARRGTTRRSTSGAPCRANSAGRRPTSRSSRRARTLTTPQEFEAQLRAILPPWQLHQSADDYVEYCWHAPTVRFFTARPTLQSADPRYAPPAWTYNALGGLAAAVDPGMFLAGKTIAATLIDLLTQPETTGPMPGRVA